MSVIHQATYISEFSRNDYKILGKYIYLPKSTVCDKLKEILS